MRKLRKREAKIKVILKLLALIILAIMVWYIKNDISAIENYNFRSQWESTIDPETSCGLSVLTNINNIEKGEEKSLDDIRDLYPPDYDKFYTMEYIKSSLDTLGIESKVIDLNEYYGRYLKDGYIIMCIDNFYIEENSGKGSLGKSYNNSFKHFIIAMGTKKIRSEEYIKVYDPYEKDEGIRLYHINQLQKAIDNNTKFGYYIANKSGGEIRNGK